MQRLYKQLPRELEILQKHNPQEIILETLPSPHNITGM